MGSCCPFTVHVFVEDGATAPPDSLVLGDGYNLVKEATSHGDWRNPKLVDYTVYTSVNLLRPSSTSLEYLIHIARCTGSCFQYSTSPPSVAIGQRQQELTEWGSLNYTEEAVSLYELEEFVATATKSATRPPPVYLSTPPAKRMRLEKPKPSIDMKSLIAFVRASTYSDRRTLMQSPPASLSWFLSQASGPTYPDDLQSHQTVSVAR